MEGVIALFDTNILIDYLSGVPAARREMERYDNIAISVITWMEVMAGVLPEHETKTRVFLHEFCNLAITPEVADRAVHLRREWKIKLPDAIILATAEVDGRLLVTRNTKDFPADYPGVRVPYRL